jgi:hypothetical protein
MGRFEDDATWPRTAFEGHPEAEQLAERQRRKNRIDHTVVKIAFALPAAGLVLLAASHDTRVQLFGVGAAVGSLFGTLWVGDRIARPLGDPVADYNVWARDNGCRVWPLR